MAGTEMLEWVDMFNQCHDAKDGVPTRIAWPDGGCYNDQPNIVVQAFMLLDEVYRGLTKAPTNG